MNRRTLFQFLGAALCASVSPAQRCHQVVIRLDISGAIRGSAEFKAAMTRAKFLASELHQISMVSFADAQRKWIETQAEIAA